MSQPNTTKLPLLRSESATEFLAFRKRLNKELQPTGVIEEEFLEDYAALIWEKKRLRSWRVSTIEKACGPASEDLFRQVLLNDGSKLADPIHARIRARTLGKGWLENDPATKQEAATLLAGVGLDDSAIQAEAIGRSSDLLQYFDRSLATASGRLDRLIRMMMDYRASDFAARLRQKSSEILSESPAVQSTTGNTAEKDAA
jgi:hypothetical protein